MTSLSQLTIHAAADRLGLTDRRMRQLVVEHDDIPSVGRGRRRRFLWPALREWRDRQLVAQGVQSVRARAQLPPVRVEGLEPGDLVSRGALARLLGISPATIRGFHAHGIPCVRAGTSGRRFQYPWPAALQWWVSYRVAAVCRVRVALRESHRR